MQRNEMEMNTIAIQMQQKYNRNTIEIHRNAREIPQKYIRDSREILEKYYRHT